MANILVVTLTAKGLDVDQSGGHHWIAPKGSSQEILWVLSGAGLAHARFVLADRKRKPGFDWIQGKPPSGVFGDPHLLADGRVLALRVRHVGKKSEGWWKYVLRVRCCGEEFATVCTEGDPDFTPPPETGCEPGVPCGPKRQRMIHDPVIINR